MRETEIVNVQGSDCTAGWSLVLKLISLIALFYNGSSFITIVSFCPHIW